MAAAARRLALARLNPLSTVCKDHVKTSFWLNPYHGANELLSSCGGGDEL